MLRLHDKTLFDYLRNSPFSGRMSQAQVDGVMAIVAAWLQMAFSADLRHLAYILATAFHETGARMQPVREGMGSDAKARRLLAGVAYGKPDPATGQVYYGRGLVQLTWARNYKSMGALLGLGDALYRDPDRALQLDLSVRILIEGMHRGASTRGDFTGKSLEDYFNASTDDPVGARRIVNGTDKASLIASYYRSILDALRAAEAAAATGAPPADVRPGPVQADKPVLARDRTTIGFSVTTVAGLAAAAAPVTGAVNNPWAFALLALVLGIGVWLFVSGRLSLAHRTGA